MQLRAIGAVFSVLLAGACATTEPREPPRALNRPDEPPPDFRSAEAEPSTGARTARAVRRGAGQVRDGFGAAVQAPLEDLNIKRSFIPPVLIRAQRDAYGLEGMTRCETIAAEVGSLDDALGPDMDEPPPPPGTRVDRGANAAAGATLDVVRDTASGVIPFRGWVRQLTGAAKHSREVQTAIRAGTIRRSYLKGVGMRMNCAPPAAPSWFEPDPSVRMPVAEAGPAPAAQPPRRKSKRSRRR